jgi:hypothetical protein
MAALVRAKAELVQRKEDHQRRQMVLEAKEEQHRQDKQEKDRLHGLLQNISGALSGWFGR